MVLGLLAVEAVGQVPVVVPEERGRSRHSQRYPLVGRAEETVDPIGQVLLDAGGVVVPQPGRLGPRLVVARVDKVGGLAPRLGGEVPEGEHAGAHHEGDEFLFVRHTKNSFSLCVRRRRRAELALTVYYTTLLAAAQDFGPGRKLTCSPPGFHILDQQKAPAGLFGKRSVVLWISAESKSKSFLSKRGGGPPPPASAWPR